MADLANYGIKFVHELCNLESPTGFPMVKLAQ